MGEVERIALKVVETPSWWHIWKAVEENLSKPIRLQPLVSRSPLKKEELEKLGTKEFPIMIAKN